MRSEFSKTWVFLTVTFIAAVVTGLLVAAAAAQQVEASKTLPQVEWEDHGNGWISIDQANSGGLIGIRRSAISSVAYFEKDSEYATLVYRDNYDLVVLAIGSKEWRVRCPDVETAAELAEFIIRKDK